MPEEVLQAAYAPAEVKGNDNDGDNSAWRLVPQDQSGRVSQSVYSDWGRQQVWSATFISVWQHVTLAK